MAPTSTSDQHRTLQSELSETGTRQVRHNTYGQILKSSALIGGSSAFNIALGIARTKAWALLLGPAGLGIMGIYSSILDLARTVAGMGVSSSAVREIAYANGSGDSRRTSLTVSTVRRLTLLLAGAGAVALVLSSDWISLISFGNNHQASGIALLAIAVFFSTLSGGQTALIQGFRRIGDLARVNVLGGLLGTIAGILLICFLQKRGIVPALVAVSAATLLASWWYSRRLEVEQTSLKLSQFRAEAQTMLSLGFVLMASGFMTVGVAFFVRIIVLRDLGEDAAGFYQSAWTLGGLYGGFVLQAMAADFFPRLSAVAGDNRECNRLVNEQAEISLLLALPGIIGTLAFASFVIDVFYSGKFEPAVGLLRWICMGMMVQVASWPMGFIVLAKGARRLFFWSELVASVVQVALIWVFIRYFGLNGTGIGFFAENFLYWFVIYSIVRSLSGFRWSAANKELGAFYAISIPLVFVSWYFLPLWAATCCGGILALVTGVYSLKRLCKLVPSTRLPRFIQRVLALSRIVAD